LPPEKSRQKLSSLVTLSTKQLDQVGNAVTEPTSREAAVRQEMEERKSLHDAANKARALDSEAKRLKLLKRYREDLTEGQVCCLLVRIETGNGSISGKDMFKICANARQNHLQGMFASLQVFSVVYVEGGPAAVKRYKNLVTNRMPDLKSAIVFEGVKRRPEFKTFHSDITSEFDARVLMEERGCLDVWIAAKSFLPPD
jgi:U4/U6 small nuclear ribonucleoprotein PRP3